MSSTPFPCTGCGICCRLLPRHKPGWPLREDGACRHLTADNRCSVYETRPEECRINAMHPVLFKEMPLAEYHRLTAELCNEMQAQTGIPESFRVKIQ